MLKYPCTCVGLMGLAESKPFKRLRRKKIIPERIWRFTRHELARALYSVSVIWKRADRLTYT